MNQLLRITLILISSLMLIFIGFYVYDQFFSSNAVDRKTADVMCQKVELGMSIEKVSMIAQSSNTPAKTSAGIGVIRAGDCICITEFEDGKVIRLPNKSVCSH